MSPADSGLTVLDLAELDAGPSGAAGFLARFRTAAWETGFFYLIHHGIPDPLCQAVLDKTRAFFALPEEDKQRIHISRSDNFRGYSAMESERDWREQLHFGLDWPEGAWAPGRPDPYRLAGANPWPGEPPGFAAVLADYLAHCQRLGDRLLGLYAEGLGLAPDHFRNPAREPPYLLLKQIAYRPQDGNARRNGVAGHCDWSWFTLLLQDDVGGFAILDRSGHWRDAPPRAGALTVTTGELMEYASGGRYRATPHRVVNPSRARTRFSVPVFINPALDAPVARAVPPAGDAPQEQETEHVHRVLPPGFRPPPFLFGDSEWRRKGLGRWCHRCTGEESRPEVSMGHGKS
jgi:isopenicillin N synthase-like dioxygenase